MNINSHCIVVGDLTVDVIRKDIKNLHLGVYPPQGRVRVAVPLLVNDEMIRLAIIQKLSWIKRQQSRFQSQPRQSQREMVDGESHYFMGQRYRLVVTEHNAPPKVVVRDHSFMDLFVRPHTTVDQRQQVLHDWYRVQLGMIIPPLLDKWQRVLGVQVADWRIRRMKTRWGSCVIQAKRIWFNLELAKKPLQQLEYVVVHELAHLLERGHGDRFIAILDRVMPQWRYHRDALNHSVLGHDSW
ncbi:MAG: M48 family metallopeptidase [Magnetococcales bacterium]|nr:M48 family metallopeptidase [Magnetococcales bacterium]